MNSTPPNNFTFSRRSILKSGDFNKSHKSVRFDKSVSYQQMQMEEERMEKERELQREQKEQEEAEEFYRTQNGVPTVSDFSRPEINALVSRMAKLLPNVQTDSQVPADPRHALMETNFQLSATRTSSNNTYTPVNFGESRFGAIGSERKKNNELNASARFESSQSSFISSSQRLPPHNFRPYVASPSKFNTSVSQQLLLERKNFSNSRQSFTASSRNTSLKKALCIEWRDHQTCRYGATCKYAHGIDELGLPNVHIRPKMCHYVQLNQICPFGRQCRFSHSPTESFHSSGFASSFVRSHRNR